MPNLGSFLSGSDAGIERLTITAHQLKDCSDGAKPEKTFKCQVNPEKLKYKFGVKAVGQQEEGEVSSLGGAGQSAAPNAFTTYNEMILHFQFHADATGILPFPKGYEDEFVLGGESSSEEFSLGGAIMAVASGNLGPAKGIPSIRKHLVKLQNTVYGFDPEIHGPPYLKLVWGNVFPKTSNDDSEDPPAVFKGILESCEVEIVLFSLKGEPIKAKIDLKIKSQIAPEQRPLGKSPDLTHHYNINHGEKMTTYCNKIYGRYDSKICAAVAEYNGMVDWELPAGKKMTFPSIHLLEADYLHKYQDTELKFVKDESDDEFMRDLIGDRRYEQHKRFQDKAPPYQA